jgi:hypothetical protein
MIEFHRCDGTVFIDNDPGGFRCGYHEADGRITQYRREQRLIPQQWWPKISIGASDVVPSQQTKEVFVEVMS